MDKVRHSGCRTHVSGSTDLGRLLPDQVTRHRLVVTPEFFRNTPVSLHHYPVIANMITEPEHSAGLLRELDKMLSAVSARIINPPALILQSTRDRVAELLVGIDGLIAPKTARFRRNAPEEAARALSDAGRVILREAGTHGGKIIGIFDSFGLAEKAIESDGDHIATQFIDFRSPDGLYRKYRVFFIGPHRILRHLLIAESWVVHGGARYGVMVPRPELVAEERALFERESPFPPRIENVFEAIRSRIGLDFFGMDFALSPAGDVVLFEANATMSFMPNLFVPDFPYLRRCYPPAQAAFMELLGVASTGRNDPSEAYLRRPLAQRPSN